MARPGGLTGLSDSADRVLQSAWAAVDVLSGLDEVGPVMRGLRLRSDELRDALGSGAFSSSDYGVARVLHSALSATTIEALDREWENYAAIAEVDGPSDGTCALVEGDDGVFAVRQSWLATRELLAGLSADFEDSAALMRSRAGELLDAVSARFSVALARSLANFDRGRLLLFVISAVSVVLATLVAWLWVGNMVVRRLSRLSDRIRATAAGDLDTRCPRLAPTRLVSWRVRWRSSGIRRLRFSVSTWSSSSTASFVRPMRSWS